MLALRPRNYTTRGEREEKYLHVNEPEPSLYIQRSTARLHRASYSKHQSPMTLRLLAELWYGRSNHSFSTSVCSMVPSLIW